MADRYWVGGAGTWDATTTTNWSATSGGLGGASAPTSADNVIFNTLSNATAYAVTVGTNANALDITIAGPAVGNVTITSGATAAINCYGSWLNAATGVVFTTTTGALLQFAATTTGKTITTNNVNLGTLIVNFNNASGGWTLGSAFTVTTAGTVLTAGSLNTNNFAFNGAAITGSGTGVRSLTLGSSTITLTGASVWVFTTTTNLTFNAGTSTINCSNASPTFAGGGLTYYNVTFTGVTALTHTINGANTFNNLTFTSRTTDGVGSINISANQTISGTLTLGAANTAVRRLFVRSDTIGTQRTLTVATIATLSDVDFQDTVAAGASGTFSGTRLGNCTNNSNITFSAGQTVYWNLAGAQNWSAVAWATSSGGAPAVNNFPLAQDTAIFDNTGSVTGTITIQSGWTLPAISITKTGAMTLASGTTAPRIFGGLTLQAATVTTGTVAWTYAAYGVASTFTSNTATLTPPLNINAPTGTVTLADGFTAPSTVTTTLTAGTLNLNNFTLSTGLFTSAGTNTLAFGTGNITLTGTGTIFTGSTTTTVTGTPQVICNDSSATSRTINAAAVTEANSISFRITAGTGTLGSTGSSFRDLDFTDGVNPTGFAGTFNNNTITVYGNFKASTGMTQSAGTAVLTFAATSGTKTIDTAGVTFDRPFTFNGAGGTFQLASALTSGATRTCTLAAGTLDLAGYTLTTGLFSSTNINVRTLAFGTGKIVLTATSGSIFTTSASTNLTVTGTNPLIQATAGGAGTRSITIGAGSEANAISVDVTSGSDIISLGTTNGAYKNVDFTGFTGTVSLSNSIFVFGNWNYGGTTIQGAGAGTVNFAATSGTKTITSNGFSFPGNVTFSGVGGTFQLQDNLTLISTATTTLTNGTLDLSSYTLSTGLFSSNNSNTRVLAFGTGKIVLTGNTATIWTNATGTGFTYTGTSRIEAPGPATTGQRLLTPSTTATSTEATALNFYITGGSDTINFSATSRRVNILDFTGFTGTFTNSALTVHGNYTLAASPMVVGAGTEITTFATTTSQNITTNAQTLDFPVTFDGIGGTFACQDALTLGSTRALTMTNGTLQLKSGTTNTVGSFVTSGTTQKFLSATTPGTQATLSQASGTDSVSYLTIQDSAATGGAVFQSYISDANVNSGNNTGWNFGNVIAGNVITETATGTDTVASIGTFFSSLQETATGTDAINGRPFWDVINNTQTANWSAISTT